MRRNLVLLLMIFLSSLGFSASQCPGIYRRFQWGARPSTEIVNMTMPLPNIIIHHTVMGDGDCTTFSGCVAVMKTIQNFHMDDRGWADIGYSFLIGEEGSIFEGRGWDRVGAHAPSYNDKSVGISLIGDYMNKMPPQIQVSSVKKLIECGIALGKIMPQYALYGHRDVSDTDCPGDLFYEEELSNWPSKQTTAPPSTTVKIAVEKYKQSLSVL